MYSIARRKISYIPLNVKVIDLRSKTEACPYCNRINTRHKGLKRTVVDISLEEPTVVIILYNTYVCRNPDCRHHYQSPNPIVRKGGRYTDRAKLKTRESVTLDGVTIRATRARVQRDFNIAPANATISRWGKEEASLLVRELPSERVIEEFSGVLCIDEAYDKGFALLVAVEPVSDKTVAYKVTKGNVKDEDIQRFLENIREAGLEVHTVVTDGSSLYPNNLKNAFGHQIRHQLCLFHLSKNVLEDVRREMRNVIFEQARNVKERREILKEMNILLRNPANIVKRTGKTSRSQKRWAERHEELLEKVKEVLEKYPYLKVYSDFMREYYFIWDAETEEETWRRRDELLNNPLYQEDRGLKRAMKRLEDEEIFKQYLYSFQDPQIPRTNNAAERANRRFRQQQKRRYRGLSHEKKREDGEFTVKFCQVKNIAA